MFFILKIKICIHTRPWKIWKWEVLTTFCENSRHSRKYLLHTKINLFGTMSYK